MRTPVDLLHVSTGTTGGWRLIDEALRQALAELGVRVERVAIRRPRGGLVHRAGSPINDIAQSVALVAAAQRGVRRLSARAIIYSSSHAALLQPPRSLPQAVWVDGSIRHMRPEVRNLPLRALERVRQHRLDLVLAMSLQQPELLAAPLRPRAVLPLHMPVDPSSGESHWPAIRPPFGIMYAGSPGKKGLDIAVEAWRLAAPDMLLVVTGISHDRAASYLDNRLGSKVLFTGPVPRRTHRALVRQATVYVSASRREEYGTAQLEALADGVPLAAVPSAGLAEPVAVACRLSPGLVGDRISARSLASSIQAAVLMTSAQRDGYRAQAQDLMRGYSSEEFRRRLARILQ